jgi:hypothetical protein
MLSSYTVVIYGDVNGDGTVDAADMACVYNHIRSTKTLSGCYLEAADANRQNDGVNSLDMIYMNRHIMGESKIKQK